MNHHREFRTLTHYPLMFALGKSVTHAWHGVHAPNLPPACTPLVFSLMHAHVHIVCHTVHCSAVGTLRSAFAIMHHICWVRYAHGYAREHLLPVVWYAPMLAPAPESLVSAIHLTRLHLSGGPATPPCHSSLLQLPASQTALPASQTARVPHLQPPWSHTWSQALRVQRVRTQRRMCRRAEGRRRRERRCQRVSELTLLLGSCRRP